MQDNILEMRGISKSFPGVRALRDVSFSVKKGEIHALVGENGAGKSTLMKILDGVYQADTGEIFLNGEKIEIKDTNQAKACGIGLIFQEFNLINSLSAAENIFLNRMPKKHGKLNWKEINSKAKTLVDGLGFDFDVREKVENLSAAQRQLVEIAKVLSLNAKLIVMDEPTSSLTNAETENLISIITRLKSEGITVIYISHKMEEIFRICDSCTVLRDGEIIETRPTSAFSQDEIIECMVGRSVDVDYPRRAHPVGEVVLEANQLCRSGIIQDISFTLRKGEILGIAGLVGSGRTELAEVLFGAAKCDSGELLIHGEKVRLSSTYDGKKTGIGLLTEDRKETGLVLSYDLVRNISITNLEKIKQGFFLSAKKESQLTLPYQKELNIKTPSMKQLAINLSGGNQQKVVFAKWLFADAEILILDEPTRGIDVGAKYEIYLLMNRLVEQGKSIIMISSELPEVLGMSDRVLVLSAGKMVGELHGEECTPEAVMRLAIKN